MTIEPGWNPAMIVPLGTQVVTRAAIEEGGQVRIPAGAVGVVTRSPVDATHSYRVRFPDGFESSLVRSAFTVLKLTQTDGLDLPTPQDECDLRRCIIYRCIVGSRAYGLDHDESDTDRRGIYLPQAERHWSLWGVPEQLESEATQECYWELQKFLVLALKANPNILECLFTPLVERETELAAELRAMRGAFLSRLVYQTYNGYVLSQFRRIGQDLRNQGAIKWKHPMHLIRLLLSGITALREGVVPVRVEEHGERLLAIRAGLMPWAEVESWRLELHREFDAAYAATKLPERPDYERVNAYLVRVRKSAV